MSERPSRTEVLEFVAELGKRFPDMSDGEVIDAIDEFEGNDGGYTNPNSPFGLVYLQAYTGGVKAASRMSMAMFGIDMTKDN